MSLLEKLHSLSIEAREVDLGYSIERIHVSELTSFRFMRDYVAKNKPCIITGSVESWPAYELWDEKYLIERGGDSLVTVDMTPNGKADAVTRVSVNKREDRGSPMGSLRASGNGRDEEDWFCSPLETKMTFRDFFDDMRASRSSNDRVLYLQHQNNSLNIEAPWLVSDTKPFPFAEAFGGEPEATNLWIGDERSKTTFHKDHYENVYSVIRGTKTFTLLPPLDVWRMHMREYPCARWTRDQDGVWQATRSGDASVPWCPIPIGHQSSSPSLLHNYPHFYNPDLPPPMIADVSRGDTLYLPSCWYHSVEQEPSEQGGMVMAVNSWFDMQFDTRWPYFQLVESLGKELVAQDQG